MAATTIEMTPMLTNGEREESEGGPATPAGAAPIPRGAKVDVKLPPEPFAIEPEPTSNGTRSNKEYAGTIDAAGAGCGPLVLCWCGALVEKIRDGVCGHMPVVKRALWAVAIALYVVYFVAAMYVAAVRSSTEPGFILWRDEPTRRLLCTPLLRVI